MLDVKLCIIFSKEHCILSNVEVLLKIMGHGCGGKSGFLMKAVLLQCQGKLAANV